MITDIMLFLVICALGALIGYQEYNNRKEREKLIKVIISRNAEDLANLELAEKVTKIDPNPPLIGSDFIEESDLDEKDFQKYILDVNKEEDNG